MKRLSLAGGMVLAVASLTSVGSASAEAPATICVPEASSKQVLSTNSKGECPSKTISKVVVKYKSEALPGPAELEKLDKLLPHIKYEEIGVGGMPTIQFSGVNLQIVNGESKTASTNGEGNLVLGYDENPGSVRGKPGAQTGSHNLILGEEQEFTSYGGIVAGSFSTVSGPFASISGGYGNTASGTRASIIGGTGNTASSEGSSVTGGKTNHAEGLSSSIGGGNENQTTSEYAYVGGGLKNTASGPAASVTGGESNNASGITASVTGGRLNKATGFGASIGDGELNAASGGAASVSGGRLNKAEGAFASIFGGRELTAKIEYEALPSCIAPPKTGELC